MEQISEWLEPDEKIEATFRIGRVKFLFMVLYQLFLLLLLSIPYVIAIVSVGIVMDEMPLLIVALVPVLFVVTIIANKVVSHVLDPNHLSKVLGTVDMPSATSIVYLTNRHIGQKAIHKHPLIAYSEIESIRPMDGATDRASEFLFGVRKVQIHTHFKVQSMTVYLPRKEYDKVLAHMHSKMHEGKKKEGNT